MSHEEEFGSRVEGDNEVSLQELLADAIKSEIESANTYRNLLEKDLPEKTREKIERLVTQEEDHEEKFSSIFEDFFPENEVPLPDRSEIEIPGEIPENASPDELIKKAMATERESEEFYNDLSEEFSDMEVKRLLGYLAATEREHYEILKEELTRLE